LQLSDSMEDLAKRFSLLQDQVMLAKQQFTAGQRPDTAKNSRPPAPECISVGDEAEGQLWNFGEHENIPNPGGRIDVTAHVPEEF